jgi:AraC-like DNA-binding protein
METAILWPLRVIPVIRGAGRFPLDDRAHQHAYLSTTHALHLHEYEGELRMGGQSYPLRPGIATLTPANLKSTYDLRRGGYHWCTHFNVPRANRPRLNVPTIHLPYWLDLGPRRTFAIARLKQVAALFAQADESSPTSHLAAASAAVQLQDLLLWLATISHAGRPSATLHSDTAVHRAAEILNTRFTDELDVPALANEVALTQNYLARRFKQRFGMTIPRYLLTRRMQHAQLLLGTTNIPIQRIAQRVGMPDIQHFNKQFRRLAGMSPTAFRSRGKNSFAEVRPAPSK